MNRNDEFMELKKTLEQTPIELEYVATKAISKTKIQRRRSILWKTPLISFCSIAVLFVLLVNMFPAVALAMSNVPILKNLVIAVALDPSLKLAVENDYFQVVGESQTEDDVTVTVEYMILDAGHISLFFSVDAPVKAGIYHYDFTDGSTRPFPAAIFFDTMYETDKLEELKIDFVEGNDIPEEIVFKLSINVDQDFQETVTMVLPVSEEADDDVPPTETKASGTEYEFRFVLHPDKVLSQTVDTVLINQWIEIKEQRIYLDCLDIYPTQARLYYHSDENNSAVIEGLNIWFEDDKGVIYDTRKNGLTGTGDATLNDTQSLYFETSYFTDADTLKMYIDGISIIEKEQLYGVIDYSKNTITNMPEGVSIDTMELKNSTLKLKLKAVSDKPNHTYEIIYSIYNDTDGNEYHFGSWSTGYMADDEPNIYYSEYQFENYSDNKYKLRWSYSPIQLLEEPIEIDIK
jgi:hypothetical protein